MVISSSFSYIFNQGERDPSWTCTEPSIEALASGNLFKIKTRVHARSRAEYLIDTVSGFNVTRFLHYQLQAIRFPYIWFISVIIVIQYIHQKQKKNFYSLSWTHKLFWFPDICTSFLPTSTREVNHKSIKHREVAKRNLFL